MTVTLDPHTVALYAGLAAVAFLVIIGCKPMWRAAAWLLWKSWLLKFPVSIVVCGQIAIHGLWYGLSPETYIAQWKNEIKFPAIMLFFSVVALAMILSYPACCLRGGDKR